MSHLFDPKFILTAGICLLIHVGISSVRVLGHFWSFRRFSFPGFRRKSRRYGIQTHVGRWPVMLGSGCSRSSSNFSSEEALLHSISGRLADFGSAAPGHLRAEDGLLVDWGGGGRWSVCAAGRRTGATRPHLLL